jgi:hypothetical protein
LAKMGCNSSKTLAVAPKPLLAEARSKGDVQISEDAVTLADLNATRAALTQDIETELEGTASPVEPKVAEDWNNIWKVLSRTVEAAQLEAAQLELIKGESNVDSPALIDASQNVAIGADAQETKLDRAIHVEEAEVEDATKQEAENEPKVVEEAMK